MGSSGINIEGKYLKDLIKEIQLNGIPLDRVDIPLPAPIGIGFNSIDEAVITVDGGPVPHLPIEIYGVKGKLSGISSNYWKFNIGIREKFESLAGGRFGIYEAYRMKLLGDSDYHKFIGDFAKKSTTTLELRLKDCYEKKYGNFPKRNHTGIYMFFDYDLSAMEAILNNIQSTNGSGLRSI